ncbi:unnamed protein product [Spirodela intermedia]|uniref:Uncharacterized protein n=1 Tax=Spirodela intermedia TaxID=51605 RepID=A0A7I8JJ33_SPIIN|nr:unnamed protein product [Spirodela intermedia]CAA6670178.1 unnamed protein product [Spirodela intermedia]
MVPSPVSAKQTPQFPQCIDWVLENQHPDGSWGSHDHHSSLMRDALASTLACVIALKRWNLGEKNMEKGINFIMSNWSAISDEKQHSPIGFNIIFPGMITLARKMDLYLPLSQWELEKMFHLRELELKRAFERTLREQKRTWHLFQKGWTGFQSGRSSRKYQRKNGSILDSPSTTAAALAHHCDGKCLEYLQSLVQKFENAVPSQYPSDTLLRLQIIDLLEGLGISQHFINEIKNILDEVHRQWLKNDEEIKSSMIISAMAFRLLRMNGYEILSGSMDQIDEEYFQNSLDGYLEDSDTILELYKASQIKFPNEWPLKELGIWTRNFLVKELSKHGKDERLKESPSFASLQRLEHRRSIAQLNIDRFQTLKMSHVLRHPNGKEILAFVVEEFNGCQYLYRKELEHLERWVKENRLDQLKLPRQKLTYCYFSAAATLFPYEMSDARISWAKNGVLTTLVDDFFDVVGSREELINLMQLVDQLEEDCEVNCCSEQVKIIYSALHATINEIGAKASAMQGYSVLGHIINIWRDLLRSFMKEAEWAAEKAVPTMEQYLANGYVSFALGPIILPALYFIGPVLSPGIIEDPEYSKLYQLVSICGRLLNDMQSFEREDKEGKPNSVSLLVLEGGGSLSVEGAKEELRHLAERNREELLELVLKTEGSTIPRACKDLFWNMSRILHLFYSRSDGFSSPTEMVGAVNSVIHNLI